MSPGLSAALRASLSNRPRARRVLGLQALCLCALALPQWLDPSLPLPPAMTAALHSGQALLSAERAAQGAALVCALLLPFSAWVGLSTWVLVMGAAYLGWWPLAAWLVTGLVVGGLLFQGVHKRSPKTLAGDRRAADVAHGGG